MNSIDLSQTTLPKLSSYDIEFNTTKKKISAAYMQNKRNVHKRLHVSKINLDAADLFVEIPT